MNDMSNAIRAMKDSPESLVDGFSQDIENDTFDYYAGSLDALFTLRKALQARQQDTNQVEDFILAGLLVGVNKTYYPQKEYDYWVRRFEDDAREEAVAKLQTQLQKEYKITEPQRTYVSPFQHEKEKQQEEQADDTSKFRKYYTNRIDDELNSLSEKIKEFRELLKDKNLQNRLYYESPEEVMMSAIETVQMYHISLSRILFQYLTEDTVHGHLNPPIDKRDRGW